MLFRRAATLLLALIFVTPIAAAANFPGWTRKYENNTIQLISPQDANGVVQFVMGPAEQELGDPQAMFKQEIDQMVAGLGADIALAKRSGLRTEGSLMFEVLTVQTEGVPLDALIFAYDTGNKFYQAGALVYFAAIPETDKRVNHALDFIATATRKKYRLTNVRTFDATAPSAQQVTAHTTTKTGPTPSPMPATPAPAPQQSGQRCERRPIWGFRVSYWCQPSGICPDRVIKGYETVCE